MVQEGLHVGLAAWISTQTGSGGFLVLPALPFALKPVDLDAVQTMSDLAKVAEFARIVNFVPRKGQYAEALSGTDILWAIHCTLLSRMIFAVRPWTAEEESELKAARATLFMVGPGGFPVMTSAFQLYEELRIAYAELEASGADPGELAAAHAAWISAGNKLEIEAALATINRLGRRSSLTQAEMERLAIEPERLLSTSDGSYAPTEFSPLSAVRVETWLGGEATFEELDSAVGNSEAKAKWFAWRAGRSGSVSFHYAALHIRRPWFTVDLYDADDWHLDEAGESTVSVGDGVRGILPAYVRSAYLVMIDELQTGPRLPLVATGIGTRQIGGAIRSDLGGMASSGIMQRVSGRTNPSRVLLAAGPAGEGVSLSVMPRRGVLPTSTTNAQRLSQTVAQPVLSASFAASARVGDLRWRQAQFGRSQRLDMLQVSDRLSLARALSRAASPRLTPLPPPATKETAVVGFGCVSIPSSPAPNPNYQWT